MCALVLCPVKGDCVSDGEDDLSADALVEEMLQQGDTAVIYPEAPDDDLQRQGTPDASVHDENGTGHHTADRVPRSHMTAFSRGLTVTELSHCYNTYPVITHPQREGSTCSLFHLRC